MHRYNNKYGYGRILRQFCGVGDDTPIWGEIQHSLFMNTRYFTADGRTGPPREQLQRFPRLLSWQSLLPFPHQIPIGDPLLYSQLKENRSTESPNLGLPGQPFAVFMPKLNDEVALRDRLDGYFHGAKDAIECASPSPLVVAFHPREVLHRDDIERRFSGVAEVLWAPEGYPGGPTAWSNALVKQSEMVVSDYFGAHVFRASAYFDTPISLVGDALFNPGFDPTMDTMMRDFLAVVGNQADQRAISEKVLGVEFQRSRDELRDILGFVGWKKVAGRPVRVIYQRVRRATVRKRRRVSGS